MYKVVIVEDENIVRQGIVRSTDWASLNCMVVGEASNGEEGLQIIRRLSPDIVITDIRMPKMTGIEMMRVLRDEGIKTHVVFLTAYDDFAYAREGIRLGIDDYVLKPFEDGRLEEAVRDLLIKSEDKSKREAAEIEAELSLKKGDKSKYLAAALAFIDENYIEEKLSLLQEKAIRRPRRNSVRKEKKVSSPYPYFEESIAYSDTSLEDFLHTEKTFQEKLFEIIDQKGLKDSEVYQHANVTKQTFSKIRSDKYYRPSKKTAFGLCISLHLSESEAIDLLQRANLTFSPSDKFDLVVQYFIRHQKDYTIDMVSSAATFVGDGADAVELTGNDKVLMLIPQAPNSAKIEVTYTATDKTTNIVYNNAPKEVNVPTDQWEVSQRIVFTIALTPGKIMNISGEVVNNGWADKEPQPDDLK